jgi:superfamily I DNA/RNA helicase
MEPRVLGVEPGQLLDLSVQEATALAQEDYLVGLVVAPEHLAGLTSLVKSRPDVGLLDRDGMTRRITVVAAPAAKGLEFDAVVVVEPAAIAGADSRGLRLLYVAMTRPIQHLSIVHAVPLPEPLRG